MTEQEVYEKLFTYGVFNADWSNRALVQTVYNRVKAEGHAVHIEIEPRGGGYLKLVLG